MKKVIAGITIVVAIILFMFFVFPTFQNNDDKNRGGHNIPTEEEQEADLNAEQDVSAFTKEAALDVMENYQQSFVSLVDSSNENGLLTDFESVSEVRNHFKAAMSENLATSMTENYIEEKDGNVYLIAKDSPTWLDKETNFTIDEVTNEHFRIIQERENALIGHQKMIYHAQWRENKWIISDIESEKLEEQVSVKQKAKEIIQAIASEEIGFVANAVHSKKGLLFSPYVHIEDDAVTFEKNEVTSLLENDQTYLWGNYVGSGKAIELTPNEYFDAFIQAELFLNPDEVLVDTFKKRGNMINNIAEVFPKAKVVELYREGSEEYGGMDWSSINLVFEQNENGIWKLVALITDQWTI